MSGYTDTAISDNPATGFVRQPTIVSFLKDLPNLCSLAGLACTTLSIYCVLIGVYQAAMIGMVWAVAFDWADGLIARRTPGRTGDDRHFGGQLDMLIDIVSYGVTPAVLLLSYGEHAPIFLLAAFVVVAAGVLRLSYFATYGLGDELKYTGLALDNNSLIIVFAFMFEPMFGQNLFSYVLLAIALVLAVLNVSQIRTPKLSGKPLNVWGLAVYTLLMSSIYGSQLA